MFTFPTLLWGLLFLAVPLIIHLINLLRHRRVTWGAMEFLLAAYKRHRTRMRLLELLLLLMRLGIVALLVVLAAQPVLKNRMVSALGGVKTHWIVVLDDSYSMSDRAATDRVDGQTVFDRAKNVVAQLAEEASGQPGTQNFTLLRTSRVFSQVAKPDLHELQMASDFTTQLQNVLDPLVPSHGASTCADALKMLDKIVPPQDGERRVVYVLSDFRKRDWAESSEVLPTLAPFQKAGATLYLVDCAQARHENLAISDLKPARATRAANVPLEMSFRVTNYGELPAKNVVVHPSVLSNDATQVLPGVQLPLVPAGESVEEKFVVQTALQGNHTIFASLDADAVSDDNTAWASVEFPPFESILVIDPSVGAATSKALTTALAPGGTVNTGLVIRVEEPRFLSTNPLNGYRTIFLVDVPALDNMAVTALEEFLENGGGVAIFLGPNSDPVLTQKWHRDGAGFFPVLLDSPSDLGVDYLQKIPDLRVATHPIFRIFTGDAEAFLRTVNVSRYWTLDDATLESLIPMAESEAEKLTQGTQVIAMLRNNAPLAVEKSFGKGRVVLFLTTADATWNNWSRANPSFVVAMLELQAYLAHSGERSRPWHVGESLLFRFSSEDFAPEIRFFLPDGKLLELVNALPQKDGTLRATTSAPIEQAGIYVVQAVPTMDSEPRFPLAVNVPPGEGALERVTSTELAQTLQGIPFKFLSAGDSRVADDTAGGVPIAPWLVYVLLLWMLLEMLLARFASGHLKEVRS